MTENAVGTNVKNDSDRRSIEGVATTTTGFVGPCRYGPLDPQVVTSVREFESIYGDGRPLVFELEKPGINYLWQSVRAFFEQGGRRLYIERILNAGADAGFASQEIGSGLQIRARFPGSAGNLRVRFTFISQDAAALPLITISVFPHNSQSPALVWKSMSFQSALETFSVTPAFSPEASPIVIIGDSALLDGRKLWESILATKPALPSMLLNKNSSDDERSVESVLSGGTDGVRPRPADYSVGLKAFENVSEITIVAAPGSTANFAENGVEATAIIQALIAHAERMRYRFAVLDSGNLQSESDILALRAKMNSSFAALYYPWVRILDPVSETPIDLPPSGFVAGIYVRHDTSKSVSSAPANEVVNLATGFEQAITQRQQGS